MSLLLIEVIDHLFLFILLMPSSTYYYHQVFFSLKLPVVLSQQELFVLIFVHFIFCMFMVISSLMFFLLMPSSTHHLQVFTLNLLVLLSHQELFVLDTYVTLLPNIFIVSTWVILKDTCVVL